MFWPSAAEGRDSDYPLDALIIESLARWPGEIHISGLNASGLEVRGKDPEHRVGVHECMVDDIDVAMGTLNNLDALACG